MPGDSTGKKICSHAEFRRMVQADDGEFLPLPEDAFTPVGTSVRTVLLVLPTGADTARSAPTPGGGPGPASPSCSKSSDPPLKREEMSVTIRIVHTRADGTLIEGSRKGDGVWEIVRAHGFSYSRHVGIYLRGSRGKRADRRRIEAAAQALRAVGHTVTVEIDDATPGRSFAEEEADRAQRAEERAARYTIRAARNAAAGAARWKHTRERMSAVPPGQPVLVGHHSEGRHRRLLGWAERQDRRAVEELRAGRYWAGRAQAARDHQRHRYSVGATLRRLDRLKADRRSLIRLLEEGGADQAALQADLAQLEEEIAYWRDVLKEAEQSGVKLWGPDDFTPGDFVIFWDTAIQVMRVNPKSLTIPWAHYWAGSGLVVVTVAYAEKAHPTGGRINTDRLPYDKVQGRLTADEAEQAEKMPVAEARELIRERVRQARGLPPEDGPGR